MRVTKMTERQSGRMESGRATTLLWLLGLLVASILAFGVASLPSSPGQGDVTANVLLTGSQVPHDKQCPGEQGEGGYHHCCSSPSCPASVVADSTVAVICDRHVSPIAVAGLILQGRPISPEAQPPKLLSRL